MGPGSFLSSIGMIGLAAVAILAVILVLVVLVKVIKQPLVQSLLRKVFNTIFWNGLIKYNQGAFLGFVFAGLVSVQKAATLTQKLVSSVILFIEALILIYQSVYLVSHDKMKLDLKATRQKLGSLYSDLSTSSIAKIGYG